MSEEGTWRTIRGRRIFIKKGQSLREAMSESGKFDKEKLQERLRRRLGKISSETASEEWKKLTKSDIIELNNNEEIVNYFKEKHNIELSNIDKLKPEEIKPALCGVDDFLKDFPETKKKIIEIKYAPTMLDRSGEMSQKGLMRFRKDGFANYSTGVHETAHALDYAKTPWKDKKLYSEKLIKAILKEKNIDKIAYTGILWDRNIKNEYDAKDYAMELFARSIEDYYNKNDTYSIGKAIIDKLKGE